MGEVLDRGARLDFPEARSGERRRKERDRQVRQAGAVAVEVRRETKLLLQNRIMIARHGQDGLGKWFQGFLDWNAARPTGQFTCFYRQIQGKSISCIPGLGVWLRNCKLNHAPPTLAWSTRYQVSLDGGQ